MHILRNAIDHGIEPPAERQQQGKLPAANLTIRVRQSGNQTTIEILDDGRGLDLKRIKAKAIAKGIHTLRQNLPIMSIDAIQSLIFAPGFLHTRSRDRAIGAGCGTGYRQNKCRTSQGFGRRLARCSIAVVPLASSSVTRSVVPK